jgi:hypothetical protein
VTDPDRPPLLLRIAAVLAGLEGITFVLYGLAVLAAISGARATMGVTTAVFFLVYGAGLAVAAWALSRARSWARAPIVLAQLIQLGVAWSFRSGAATLLAVALAVVALVVLGGVLNPASLRATEVEDERRAD